MLLIIIMIGYSSEKEPALIISFSNLTYWFFLSFDRIQFSYIQREFLSLLRSSSSVSAAI